MHKFLSKSSALSAAALAGIACFGMAQPAAATTPSACGFALQPPGTQETLSIYPPTSPPGPYGYGFMLTVDPIGYGMGPYQFPDCASLPGGPQQESCYESNPPLCQYALNQAVTAENNEAACLQQNGYNVMIINYADIANYCGGGGNTGGSGSSGGGSGTGGSGGGTCPGSPGCQAICTPPSWLGFGNPSACCAAHPGGPYCG